jgi:hypothetical protein
MLLILYVFTFLLALAFGFLLGEKRHFKTRKHLSTVSSPSNSPVISSSLASSPLSSSPAPVSSSSPSSSSARSVTVLSPPCDSDDDDDDTAAPVSLLPTRSSSLEHRRVVIVAKQLPLKTIKDSTGKWTLEWDDSRNFLSGIAKLRVNSSIDIKWVGIPNSNVEIQREEQDAYEELLYEYDCIPVFLPKQLKQRFFNGFCKTVLWPLLHYVMPQSNQPFGEL